MKKVISQLLVICCLCIFLDSTSSAFTPQMYTSRYFDGYYATSSTSLGKLCIEYRISTTGTMSQAGVQKIRVYTSSGSLVQTITGTTDNGLLKTNTRGFVSTYTISNLTSGQSYYAVVELYAADANGSETQTVTTTTVTVQ